MEVKQIPINQIKRNPKNPRYLFDKKALEELAETIKNQGIIHPIEIDENKIIICGERRWRASKIAGLKIIPCIEKKGLTDFQKLRRQYVENAQHRDLSIVEKGSAFKSMLKYKKQELLKSRDDKHKSDYHSKGIKELSSEIGETPWTVREAMLLVEEDKIITDAIEKDEVSYTHIIEANKIDEKKVRDKIKKKILNKDFPNRETLKDTIEIIEQKPEYTEELLKKSGEVLREAIDKITDEELIGKQDLKKTVLMQAYPYIEEEYKKFHSTSLARFIDHLKKLVE